MIDSIDPTATVSTRNADVDLFNPDPDTIHAEDIAYSLGNIHRYNGHSEHPVPVLTHSLFAYDVYWHEFGYAFGSLQSSSRPRYQAARAVLAHDAPEAYLGDVTRPLKRVIGPAYGTLEDGLMIAINKRFNLPLRSADAVLDETITRCDQIALGTEAHLCFPQVLERWGRVYKPTDWHRRKLVERLAQPLNSQRRDYEDILKLEDLNHVK